MLLRFFIGRTHNIMHIPENYLSPETCTIMAAASVPVWVHAVHKVKKELPVEKLPMIGTGAAFSFLVMMINVPLIGGTTGHAVGGTLVALLFGPEAACIGVSVALLIQAVIFGDGGIISFGANCFNMAFILPYVGYYVYRLLAGRSHDEVLAHRHGNNLNGEIGKSQFSLRRLIAIAIGSYAGLNAAALCAAVEFGIQPILFKDSAGYAIYCPYDLAISVPAMMIPHLLIAGVVEAAFTIVVYTFLLKTAPNMIYHESDTYNRSNHIVNRQSNSKSVKIPVFGVIACLIALAPIGLIVTGTAWGEWGVDEIANSISNGKKLGYTPRGIANGWSLESILPDYSLDGSSQVVGYILSAIIGVALLIIVFKLISIPLSRGRK